MPCLRALPGRSCSPIADPGCCRPTPVAPRSNHASTSSSRTWASSPQSAAPPTCRCRSRPPLSSCTSSPKPPASAPTTIPASSPSCPPTPESDRAVNPTVLLLIALAGVALLLLLVLKFKFHPFVALLSVSIVVALVGGVTPKDLVSTVELGMGSVLGHIAIIIALGAMVGRIIELSGGAQALATTLIEKFGNRRTPLALTVTGFLLGIPVFFEVGVIILMPAEREAGGDAWQRREGLGRLDRSER